MLTRPFTRPLTRGLTRPLLGQGGEPPVPVAPTNVIAPVLSGIPADGQTLSLSNGSWTGFPDSYTYRYEVNGSPYNGTSNTTLLTGLTDGDEVQGFVTAINDVGSAEAASNILTVVSTGDMLLDDNNDLVLDDESNPIYYT